MQHSYSGADELRHQALDAQSGWTHRQSRTKDAPARSRHHLVLAAPRLKPTDFGASARCHAELQNVVLREASVANVKHWESRQAASR
jgi:hypothetical protein